MSDDLNQFTPDNESPEINPIFEEAQKPNEFQQLAEAAFRIKKEMSKVIIGQNDFIQLLMVSLFTGGHVLIEGVPGIAKTMTTKMLAKTIKSDFNRIQFTPDLMPADVLGTSIFRSDKQDFEFKAGPIFSQIVLIDEINRSPAKTQSALFEVMEERQVTVDGKTHQMKEPFIVLATQNPIDQEGTYKLPEAQLDRFLFRILLEYPSLEEEISILERFEGDFDAKIVSAVEAVLDSNEILRLRSLVEKVAIEPSLIKYIAEIVNTTRNHPDLFLGASPRASLNMMKSAKATAALNGRDFVTPDDIRFVSFPVLNHRTILSPEREMEGYDIKQVIEELIKQVEVPR